MPYKLEELSPEVGEQLKAELQAVLAKYDAEMGVTSSIQLLKRVEAKDPVPSPFIVNEGENPTETPKAD